MLKFRVVRDLFGKLDQLKIRPLFVSHFDLNECQHYD